jgi:hypothetical protein
LFRYRKLGVNERYTSTLNRTCFNGIFRVNRSGQFNVPYGHKVLPAFPGRAALLAASRALARATITHADYRLALARPKRGEFIYLDLDQAKPAHLGEARNGKNSKSLVFLGRLML